MEVLSKIAAILLVIILVTLLPIQYLMGHQLSLFGNYVEDETIQLVNDIREKSYLDENMYEKFLQDISKTGLMYDIEIEHAVPNKGGDTTSSKSLPGVLVASTSLNSLPVVTESLSICEGEIIGAGEIMAENNDLKKPNDGSILSIPFNNLAARKGLPFCKEPSMAMQPFSLSRPEFGTGEDEVIQSLSTHTHTDACYAGHNHEASGCTYGYVCHEGSNLVLERVESGAITTIYYKCSVCGKVVATAGRAFGSGYNWYAFQSLYRTLSGTYEMVARGGYYYSGGHTSGDIWTIDAFTVAENYYWRVSRSISYKQLYSDFPQLAERLPEEYAYKFDLNPPFTCPYANDTNPICNQVVTSITPDDPTQTVDKGGSIITTATATYLDGHTGTVNCTSNFNPNLAGTQNVTLTYTGLVGNAKTTGTRSCTVSATVKENNIPSYLTVTPFSYSVYHGSEPSYLVTVTYENGSVKTITNGYTKTGWSSGYGTKNVTFSYSENGRTVTKTVTITVKANVSVITAEPTSQTIERYKSPVFTVTAQYEDGTKYTVYDYTISGFDNTVIGNQSVTLRYTENSIVKSCSATVTVTPLKGICSVCGNVYYFDANDFDQGCPVCKSTVSYIQVSPSYVTVTRGGTLDITVTAVYLDGHTETVTGWNSNLDTNRLGSQLVMVTYMGKYAYVAVTVVDKKVCGNCGSIYLLNEDGTDPCCPNCKESLISISATPTTQTVDQGEDISLTVTAAYHNGNSEVVTGWGTSYNANATGEQNVTVYYKNKLCSVKVTVISEEEVQCAICGTYYNNRENPFGCPVCAATLTGIEASLIGGGTKTGYGKTLELAVILTYRDGDKVLVYSGYQDNFDPNVLGEQTVTVSATDRYGNTVSCVITVIVADLSEQATCENGHLYYSSEGECPYCAALNNGAISLYSECHYTDEILDDLYSDGRYYFSAGDYVTIKVTMKTKRTIYPVGLFRKSEGITPITYGGEVA